MLDYPALAALAAVVRTGAFDKAARDLGVTPSAVSQRIKSLEERRGAPLVVRGVPCTATDAGARLLGHYDKVMLLEADLAADAPAWTSSGAATAPTLRIAVNSDSLATWFSAAAGAFARSSRALLDLVLDDEAHTAERLRSGEVLAAVTTAGHAVQGCDTRALGALRYAATASPDFARAYFRTGVSGAALAAAPVLRFDARDDLQDRWSRLAIGAAATGPTHWVPSTRGFLDLTLQGVGWSMTPEPLAEPLLTSGDLVELRPGLRIAVPLFWRHARIGAGLLDASLGGRSRCGRGLPVSALTAEGRRLTATRLAIRRPIWASLPKG